MQDQSPLKQNFCCKKSIVLALVLISVANFVAVLFSISTMVSTTELSFFTAFQVRDKVQQSLILTSLSGVFHIGLGYLIFAFCFDSLQRVHPFMVCTFFGLVFSFSAVAVSSNGTNIILSEVAGINFSQELKTERAETISIFLLAAESECCFRRKEDLLCRNNDILPCVPDDKEELFDDFASDLLGACLRIETGNACDFKRADFVDKARDNLKGNLILPFGVLLGLGLVMFLSWLYIAFFILSEVPNFFVW